jgi:hypothetical protein
MFLMQIHQNGKKIKVKKFLYRFSIIETTDGQILWETDLEPFDYAGGGTLLIWIKCTSSPTISFVSPQWQLTVDGVPFVRDSYLEIDVTGKEVSLQYQDYEFICHFSEIGIAEN